MIAKLYPCLYLEWNLPKYGPLHGARVQLFFSGSSIVQLFINNREQWENNGNNTNYEICFWNGKVLIFYGYWQNITKFWCIFMILGVFQYFRLDRQFLKITPKMTENHHISSRNSKTTYAKVMKLGQ